MITDQEMEEAAKAFWGPLKKGVHYYGKDKDLSISVSSAYENARAISVQYWFIAGHWQTQDIDLLQLCTAKGKGSNRELRSTISRLLWHIIAEARYQPPGPGRDDEVYGAGPPESILDLVTTEYDIKTGDIWLIGETFDERVLIKPEWEPEPFRIGDDGLHARWMDGHETWLELSAEATSEYDRVFKVPFEREEVEEVKVPETKLDKLQVQIDAIEVDIRALRAKERDFTSTDVEMARRLGKQNEYEELLKQRDEHMWRENPLRHPTDSFDIILKLESYHGEQSSIDVVGANGDFTYLLVLVRDGLVRNDDTAYGYISEDDAFRDCHIPQYPCYFSDGGVPGHTSPSSRNFDIVVRLDAKTEPGTKVDINTAFGTTVFAIYRVTDGWVENWSTDYGYLSEEQAVKSAGSLDGSMLVYHSTALGGPIIPQAEQAEKLSETELDAVQRGIEKIERLVTERRKKTGDYQTPSLEVAQALGKGKKYEKLLRRRDELMWRENPSATRRRKRRSKKSRQPPLTKPEQLLLREAAKAFWAGQNWRLQDSKRDLDIEVEVMDPEAGQYTDMTKWHEVRVDGYAIAARFPASTMHLLELAAPLGMHTDFEELVGFELLARIVAYGRNDPMDILNQIQVGGNVAMKAYWLNGAIHSEDTAALLSDYTRTPWKLGAGGYEPVWKDTRYMFIDLAADPVEEYDSIFKPPIERLKVEELKVSETKLDRVQSEIDVIELDIRTLRAKERDFESPNSAVAARLGKGEQYDALLKERDEAMWRENPSARIKRSV